MTMNKLPADRPTNSVTALKAKALKQTEWLLLRRCSLSNIGDRVRNISSNAENNPTTNPNPNIYTATCVMNRLAAAATAACVTQGGYNYILCWSELSRRRLLPAVSPAAGHLTTPTVAGLPGLCENFRPTTSKSSPIKAC